MIENPKCFACDKDVLPGAAVQSYCSDCDCLCCCGFLIGTVKRLSKTVDRDGESCAKKLFQNTVYNTNLMKNYAKFVKAHHPRFSEIADKYLILL